MVINAYQYIFLIPWLLAIIPHVDSNTTHGVGEIEQVLVF